jgi:hypothetical protein
MRVAPGRSGTDDLRSGQEIYTWNPRLDIRTAVHVFSEYKLLYSALLMAWAAVVVREKRGKLLAAYRGASRGLVVTGRYPQNEITGFNDGPLPTRLARAPSWLRRWEAGAYALAPRRPPDLVIKLIVTSETIAEREPGIDLTVIENRIEAIPRLAFSGARVVSINAEQPLADVIRAVTQQGWRIYPQAL